MRREVLLLPVLHIPLYLSVSFSHLFVYLFIISSVSFLFTACLDWGMSMGVKIPHGDAENMNEV